MALGHVPLAVGAHLARAQLVPDPGKVYDSLHLSDMLDVIALALARSAPLYLPDAAGDRGRDDAARRFAQRHRGPQGARPG